MKMFFHHRNELFKVDFAVSVNINFSDEFAPVVVVLSLSFDSRPERNFHFVDRDFAAAVFVEHFEGSPEVFLFQVHVLLHCCCYELGVVDCSAVVGVNRLHDGNEFVFVFDACKAVFEFFERDVSVTVAVESLEGLI